LASSVRLFPEPKVLDKRGYCSINGVQYHFGSLYLNGGYKAGPLATNSEYGGLYTADGELYRVFPLLPASLKGRASVGHEGVYDRLRRPEEIRIVEEDKTAYKEVAKILLKNNISIEDLTEDEVYYVLEYHRFYKDAQGLPLLLQQAGRAAIDILPWLINPEVVHEMSARSDEGIAPVGVGLSEMCANYRDNMAALAEINHMKNPEDFEPLWKGIISGLSHANEYVLSASYEGEGNLQYSDIRGAQHELRLLSETLLALEQHDYTNLIRQSGKRYLFDIRIAGQSYTATVYFISEGATPGIRINVFPPNTVTTRIENEIAGIRIDYEGHGVKLGLDIEGGRLRSIYRTSRPREGHHFGNHLPNSLLPRWPEIFRTLETQWFPNNNSRRTPDRNSRNRRDGV
ncbi:MAG: hypothetical protein QGI05_00530, partial [Candidatus Omnitrophota bacterium]|nr:hypothetical protein [Candidatus Omnitrophota bacterium]